MERRQFMKSAIAAAATPMLPALPGGAMAVQAETYAKAVKVANGGAFLSAKYLEFYLRVDAGTSKAIVQRLVHEGILGKSGMNGLMLSKSFFKEHGKILAASAKVGETGARAQPVLEKARNVVFDDEALAEDMPQELAEAEEIAEVPDDDQLQDEHLS